MTQRFLRQSMHAAAILAGCTVFAVALQPEPPAGGDARPRRAEVPLETDPANAARTVDEFPWSNERVANVAKMLAGSWRSSTTIPQLEGEGESRVVMHAAPVQLRAIRDCLYVELAREDSPDRPYRQAVFQILEVNGQLRLRTHEISVNPQAMNMFAGLWAAPEVFPRVHKSELVASMDIPLTAEGSGFSGATQCRFPTTLGTAVEMESAFKIEPRRLSVRDRGYDADGNVVWGASDEPIVFEPYEHGIRVERRENGPVIIEWARPEGDAVRQGDLIEWAYEAWVRDSYHFIGSSDSFQATGKWVHPGSGTIRGWRLGAVGATVGTNRTIIMQPQDGFPDGAPEMGIRRGGDVLIYHIKCLAIIPKEQLPANEGEEEVPGAGEPPAQGEENGGG